MIKIEAITKIKVAVTVLVFLCAYSVSAQVLLLDSVLVKVETGNPMLKVYDMQVKALDAYSKGARSQMPPQLEAGFFMTPYNPKFWKADPDMYSDGMGSFMIGAQQMFTNPAKLNANFKYMKSMSSVQSATKIFIGNMLLSDAKMNYYDWVIL